MDERQIVFYDGDCGFCNRIVKYVIQHDKKRTIKFAALQSEFASTFFNAKNEPLDPETFYYYWEGRLFNRSTAALHLSKHLGGLRALLFGFIIVPRPIRDGVYNFIAKRRRRLAKNYCFVPDENERGRFLS